MSKASGLFLVVAGTAILCAGQGMLSRRAADSQAVHDSADGSDLGRSADLEWWRTELPSATQAESEKVEIATVVVTVSKRMESAVKTPMAPLAKSTTPVSGDRALLARELQRELRRVGCYDGELNGAWTLETRRAMKIFTNRINATLPIEQPDFILLALVQGHADSVCGVACPTGQGLTDDSRCLPNAILGAAARGAPQRSMALPAAGQLQASVAISWSATASAPPAYRLGDARTNSADPPEALPAAPAVPSAAPIQRAPSRRMAVPQSEFRQRATFGPDFLRRADALGLH